MNRAALYTAINQDFDIEELEDLYFDLGIDSVVLSRNSRNKKLTAIRHLIQTVENQGRLDELLHYLTRERPNQAILQFIRKVPSETSANKTILELVVKGNLSNHRADELRNTIANLLKVNIDSIKITAQDSEASDDKETR